MCEATEKIKPLTEEQIVEGFQKLRYEQRAIANKITGLEMDQREHNMVIKVLKDVDSERKCFRLIDGVLVERQVKHVLPALMAEALEALRRQFDEKGVELQVYKEEHKIRLAGEDPVDNGSGATGTSGSDSGEKSGGGASAASASSGVLVT
ncbi:Prefoldin subunit 2 [Echinococcus granulosus]|uniref:Prefoldin subunit 2 n=1 Tax=Echinococcus granulosus TaxID=6210 RepID=W6UGN3_ECHGR|nr:Prefoldin subunit 2 [Echinococcus granulosus]EUB60675.1 Prefoldin subunit 2 [Echinococcus granulosus]